MLYIVTELEPSNSTASEITVRGTSQCFCADGFWHEIATRTQIEAASVLKYYVCDLYAAGRAVLGVLVGCRPRQQHR